MVRRSTLTVRRHLPDPFTALRLERLELRDVPSTVYGSDGRPAADPAATPETPAEMAVIHGDEFAETHSDGLVAQPLLAQPRGRYAVGSGAGRPAQVNVYDAQTNALLGIITPFGGRFTGGARVATGDLNADGIEDIVVSAGPGGAPWVEVYNGATLKLATKMLAYAPSFTGGVFVATGDVDGDGRCDLVTGAGEGGGPHVRMLSGADLFPSSPNRPTNGPSVAQRNFFAYSEQFHGGASVAVADVNHDGYADIVTGAGAGGAPHVIVFSGKDGTELQNFFAFDSSLRTGVSVAAGDIDGDGVVELVVAPMTGGVPRVGVYVDGHETSNFFAFDESTRSGASVAIRDIDGNGSMELVVATGPGVAPKARVIDPRTHATVREFPALTPDYNGGLFVG